MRHVLERFGANRRGSVTTVAAFTILPLLAVVGGTVDYGRAAAVRTDLERAVDATALALVKQSPALSAADLAAAGQTVFDGVYGARSYATISPITVERTDTAISVKVAGGAKNAFLSLFGHRTTRVAAAATSAWGTSKIELALVLDNTGSMNDLIDGQRKVDALKNASKTMLSKLRDRAIALDTVRVSVVPFDTEVRVSPDRRWEGWLGFGSLLDRLAWTGYVVDRNQPYDVSGTAPSGSDSLHPAIRTSQYPADLATARPLTSLFGWSDYQSVVSVIDGMRPRGNTNLALGAAWGFASLSAGAPFGNTAAPADRGVKQFMVILTDGENTQNRENGVVNYALDGRGNPIPARVARIDARATLACDAAKAGKVEVFTIRLLDGNASLLRGCASGRNGDGHYFDVQSSGDLDAAFRRILDAIAATRLTS